MKVTVYSTTTCPYCVMLKKWLDEKHVEYTNYMVDSNPYAAQMMVSQSGNRVCRLRLLSMMTAQLIR